MTDRRAGRPPPPSVSPLHGALRGAMAQAAPSLAAKEKKKKEKGSSRGATTSPVVAEPEDRERRAPSRGRLSSGWRKSEACEPLLAELQKVCLAKDPFKHPYRRRAMLKPDRALDTLEPYAKLHVTAAAARQLLACDVSGRSDPFVEVYMNDRLQGKSHWQLFTVHPEWNFTITLDVWSPLSVVQIRVMDHDTVTSHDLVGFVEFCVADLLPDTEHDGWFELRRKRHLTGYAPARVRRHMLHRDDDPRQMELQKTSEAIQEAAPPSGADWEDDEMSPARRRQRQLKAGMVQRCASAAAVCMCKVQPTSDKEEGGKDASSPKSPKSFPRRSVETLFDKAKAVLHGEVARPNAGEVRLKLKLETSGDPEDELYALCFPRPDFFLFPSGHLNFGELYRDAHETRVLMETLFHTVLGIPRYFLSWRCRPLSAAALLWWCLACLGPALVLPSAFLWIVLIVRLLRIPRWQEAMLTHESNANLNQRGFERMCRLGSTKRMAAYLKRIISSMGRAVSDERLLHGHAALVFREGKPRVSFAELVKELTMQPWVYEASKQPRCPEGHPLTFAGQRRDGDDLEFCNNPVGCMLRYSSAVTKGDACHYHCSKCRTVLCEPCVTRMRKPPLWTRMPTALVPDSLCSRLLQIETPLEQCRMALERATHIAAMPLAPDAAGQKTMQLITKNCVGLTMASYFLAWLLTGPPHAVTEWCLSLAMIVVGCFMFMSNLRWFRGYFRMVWARADWERYREMREARSFENRCAYFKSELNMKSVKSVLKRGFDGHAPETTEPRARAAAGSPAAGGKPRVSAKPALGSGRDGTDIV